MPDALCRSGAGLGVPSTFPEDETLRQDDHFILRDGVRCAGVHLIVDLYEAERLDDIAHIDRTLRRCVEAAGATLLHLHLHPFEVNGGVSGVAVLAESHISIHTWPERRYAALDVFMCGDAEPEACVPVLEAAFRPGQIAVDDLLRGKAACDPDPNLDPPADADGG